MNSRPASFHSGMTKKDVTDLGSVSETGSGQDLLDRPLIPCGTSSSCLAASSTSSMPTTTSTFDDFVDVSEVEDSKQSLRLFSWRFIRNHYSGKYNQVLFVSFSQQPGDASDALHHSVTPQRRSMLVPLHLQEIKLWLRPDSNRGRRKLDRSVEICEKRLNASLLMSQYDEL